MLKWTEILEKAYKKDSEQRKTTWILLLGITGLLLLSISWDVPKKSTDKKPAECSIQPSWQQAQEAQLQDMITQIAGAGNAKVMITLETAEETIYATDTRTDGSSSQESHVLLSGDGGGLIETTWMPQVQGVAILCEGADSPLIQRKITEMVSVLMGISSSHISIAKMN